MDSTAIALTVLNAASGSGYEPWEAPGDAELNIVAAAQQGKTEQIRALIESGRARVTDRDADAITPLHWAAIGGHAEACRYLLAQGAEVNAAGGAEGATPLQWASESRNGLAAIVDLLTRHGADPRLVDAQGYSCLHTASNCFILLYVLCRPGVHVDQRDPKDRTPLHWAVYRSDEESAQVLLALGADPNAADRDGFTALHWAVVGGNRRCIALLLEAGADVHRKNGGWRTPREMAADLDKLQTWEAVARELGFQADGTRVRRPLNEPNVKVIVFSVPTISLWIAFMIASVFPWYNSMGIIFAPASLVVMRCVVVYEILERDSIGDNISNSTYFFGGIFGSALWIAYAWLTRLRYGVPNSPAIHAALLFFFSLSMVALFCMVLIDPGACDTATQDANLKKDALKTITEELIGQNRLTTEAFCIQCLSVKRQYTRHCSTCKKCITHHGITAQYEHHKAWALNCIGAKNHICFLAFMVSLIAGIVIFDYLVWTYLTVLKYGPLPAPSCVPDYAVCELMPADMFLISIAIWSSLGLLWGMWIMICYVGAVWKVLWHSLGV